MRRRSILTVLIVMLQLVICSGTALAQDILQKIEQTEKSPWHFEKAQSLSGHGCRWRMGWVWT